MDFNSRFRLNRFAKFIDLIRNIRADKLRILDVGGEEAYWLDKLALIDRPVSITLLNTQTFAVSTPCIRSIKGDACCMSEFGNNSFDVVHSNSVIEHVGQWSEMLSMANEIRRLAPVYFVQTPYFWFPVEPHFRAVFFHWLPESARVKLLMRRKIGLVPKAKTIDQAMLRVQGSYLLDHRMFSALFPDADVVFESWMGLPKSMMAIKNGPSDTPIPYGQP